MNMTILAFASGELGVSGFTLSLILLSAASLLIGLPMILLLRKGAGKNAFSKS